MRASSRFPNALEAFTGVAENDAANGDMNRLGRTAALAFRITIGWNLLSRVAISVRQVDQPTERDGP